MQLSDCVTFFTTNVKLGKEKMKVQGAGKGGGEGGDNERKTSRSKLGSNGSLQFNFSKVRRARGWHDKRVDGRRVSTVQHLWLEHFNIMVVVGKDASVMRAKIANVRHV